jgi:hypothetical protein
MPNANFVGRSKLAFSPDDKNIVFVEEDCTCLHVYRSVFPVTSINDYKKIISVPNFRAWASNITFCLEMEDNIAIAGCFVDPVTGINLPDINRTTDNITEYGDWLKENPLWALNTVNGVTNIDYSVVGFYIAKISFSGKGFSFITRIPDDIIKEPSNMGSIVLCWPFEQEMFVAVRSAIYRITLTAPTPEWKLFFDFQKEKNSNFDMRLRVLLLTFDRNTNLLVTVCAYSKRNADRSEHTYVIQTIDKSGKLQDTFSGSSSFPFVSVTMGAAASNRNGSVVFALSQLEGMTIADLSNSKVSFKVLPYQKNRIQIPDIDAVSSNGKIVIYHLQSRDSFHCQLLDK